MGVSALTLLAACSTASSTSTPAATALPLASESVFVSPLYGYSAALSEGWRPEPATEAWTEADSFGSDSANSDKFYSTRGTTIWAVATATAKTLDQFVADQVATDAVENDCPTTLETDDATAVGGEPARLITKHCPAGAADGGALIATAALLHGGDGYFFYFIYPVGLAADPNAIDAFTSFLEGVQLP
jgi:hypothetical protein